jgi:hypothetical protein
MSKQDGFADDDTMIIDGNRVRVPELIKQPGKGVAPSYGYRKRIMTPWGKHEVCTIMTVSSLHGEKERYAHAYRPASNPGVVFSTFRLTNI